MQICKVGSWKLFLALKNDYFNELARGKYV
jgi:hypothetical protein